MSKSLLDQADLSPIYKIFRVNRFLVCKISATTTMYPLSNHIHYDSLSQSYKAFVLDISSHFEP